MLLGGVDQAPGCVGRWHPIQRSCCCPATHTAAVLAPFPHPIQAALPGMLERGQGRIVLVASTMAILGFAGESGSQGLLFEGRWTWG